MSSRTPCLHSFFPVISLDRSTPKEMQRWESKSHLNLPYSLCQKKKSANDFKLERKAEQRIKKTGQQDPLFNSTRVSLTRSGLRTVLGSN